MSWKRNLITALAVCVALAGSAGCVSRDARGQDGASPSPAGRLLDERDAEGRPYREVDAQDAPEVGVEVVPDAGGGWDVRLRVRNFRFSPDGTGGRAVAGRGLAHLEVDGRRVALLRTPEYHLSGRLVPRGTHQVTARLYADDGSVWAVDGEPVESTADITVSERSPEPDPSAEPIATGTATGAAVSASARAGVPVPPATGGRVYETGGRGGTGTRGSPDGSEQA
ncbi:hypothetical protein [Streptomyces capillispiralis]|uniref:Secreted protein n=1 Tax=Streptomyces capillispiralis TaxID=68182 RepID=A0A561TN82_9ACTN|nr:hypothetical protein [Streptomyces capillispiralis]TWF88540.1 hypothetical protein FHX78_115565 [Streptomyces capillispiralis]GHH92240.1 hypothetical protein GCM10017779_26970 [Streptomyces capillispiralis]